MTEFMKAQKEAKKKELEQIIISPECSKFWNENNRDDFKVVMVQPDKLKTLKLSAGLQIVADHIHKSTNVTVDFASLYDKNIMNLYNNKEDYITTLFNNWNVCQSDVIGIGISNPSIIKNMFEFLEKSNVKILKKDRTLYKDPFIIAGGLGVFNPAPFFGFIDAFVMGEGSIAASKIIKKYQQAKKENIPEEQLNKSLARIKGVYIPKYSKKTKFQTIKDVPNTRRASLFMSDKKALIFADYSCKFKCSFCQLSNVRGKYSFQGIEPIKKYLKEFDSIGVKEATIAGGSVTNIPTNKLEEVFAWGKTNLKTTIPVIRSVRVDDLPRIEKYLDQTEIHIAPETGSDYLRNNVMLKGFSNKTIFENISQIAHKISNVRLYHLVGIPGEKEFDRKLFVNLVEKISSILDQHHSQNLIEIYMYPLLPQPGTPMEDYTTIGIKRFQRYSDQFINEAKNKIKKSTTIEIHPLEPLWHLLQRITNTGDKKTGELLYEGYLKGNNFESYTSVCDKHGYHWREYFSNSNKHDNTKAWKNIITGKESFIETRKEMIKKSIEGLIDET
ncbi:MAG: radical SAM protein [Nanoarchaeota archaeon]|nr:hypothetical protein [Nanoarchaeota archaeon]MBU1030803.1 hypothetical protein [Nanoarchaeota archaeon]MBU1849547.1 hypothetical protein [Nanoarchaeota archaeon]